jgi:predicted amidohydrolase
MIKRLLIAVLFIFCSCSKEQKSAVPAPVKKGRQTVKVAAIQCYSRMGEIKHNRAMLTKLIRKAAKHGAKIIVLPEASISGYMDPKGMNGSEITWTSGKPDEYSLPVQSVAETVPGNSTKYFAELALELKIYLTVPLIEKDKGKFYNSMALVSPEGKVIAHHRKRELWNHGDGAWCSKGDLETQVVETAYGRLGLMICYDHHVMPPLLEEKNTDIVLYAVGWNGPADNWFKTLFPAKAKKHKFSAIVANWSHEKGEPYWKGAGYSNVLFKNGIVIKITNKVAGEHIVLTDMRY